MPEDEAIKRAREVVRKARDPKEALREAQEKAKRVDKIFRDANRNK